MFHAAVFVGILCTQSFFAVASDPFSVINGTLMFTSPVSSHNNNANVDNSGFLVQFNPSPDSSFKTFSMDIGVNRGLVLFEWLNKLPHVSIMGVEANHHMVSKLLYADTGIVALRERFVIIPGAVSTKEGIAKFNRGAGWEDKSLLPDVGSLFGWTDSGREDVRKKTTDMQQPVRLFALSDVLKHVHPPQPPHFLWDSMKIDVQGADVDAMVSAGDYLKNFICVVGEFKTDHYNVPKDVPTDPAPVLEKAGFIKAYHGSLNEIWFNLKYTDIYLKTPEKFGCHLVYDSLRTTQELVAELTAALAKRPKY